MRQHHGEISLRRVYCEVALMADKQSSAECLKKRFFVLLQNRVFNSSKADAFFTVKRLKKHFSRRLFEVFGSALGALAFIAFRDVLETTDLQNGLHYDFAAAIGAHEFLRSDSGARVFTCSSHFVPPKAIRF